VATSSTDQPTLVRAQVRHLRCSARKARVILDHVRGLSVMQAEATLQFSPRAAARDVLGVLRSASANAKENHDIDRAELVIDHCYADEDRTLKRFKPRARGRASSIHKRMCHVTIVLRHVAVAEQRDISAAAATIAAESRRARTRKAAAAPAAPEASGVDETAIDESGSDDAEATAAEPKAARKPRGKAAAAEAGESTGEEPGAEAKAPRKPRAAKAEAAEATDAESDTDDETAEPGAAAPKAPRKKPAAKPDEPAEPAADDAAEKTADEGDS
jgi:large subunit ribosomal protein L22